MLGKSIILLRIKIIFKQKVGCYLKVKLKLMYCERKSTKHSRFTFPPCMYCELIFALVVLLIDNTLVT